MKNKKAFTLIELIAVLVILAILTLIVTPLILNIIKKAKTAADRRSVDAYGRSVELAIASYTMDTGYPPTNLESLEVEYTGKEVACNVKQLKENGGLYLSQCTVNGKEVKDSKTDDGWYHYGTRDITDTEYIDMYGDALEAASVAYYQENNSKASDYTTLQIDYTGKEVSCDVTINYDGTIYLENCTVAGNQVENYTYGEIKNPPYSVGDEVAYNNVDYYVIKDSTSVDATVTLLKKTALTTAEVNQYGAGHVNMNANSFDSWYQTAKDINGYGGMAYYSSSTCNGSGDSSGCTTDYAQSEIKYVVDAWKAAKAPAASEARLINQDELESFGYTFDGSSYTAPSNRPSVLFLSVINNYWTMFPISDSSTKVWTISQYAYMKNDMIINNNILLVRPVIVLNKSVLN